VRGRLHRRTQLRRDLFIETSGARFSGRDRQMPFECRQLLRARSNTAGRGGNEVAFDSRIIAATNAIRGRSRPTD
jgi:hypothetical protein